MPWSWGLPCRISHFPYRTLHDGSAPKPQNPLCHIKQILNSAPTLLRFITSPPVLPLSLFGKATGSLIVYSTRPVPTGQPTPSGWEGKGYWSLPEQVCHLFYPTTPTTGGLDGRPTLERASTHSTSVVVQDLMIRSANICAFCGSAAERRPYASHRGNKYF